MQRATDMIGMSIVLANLFNPFQLRVYQSFPAILSQAQRIDRIDIHIFKYILSYVTRYKQMIRLSSLFVLCLLVTAFVNSQILAIDYGTQYIKASLVHVGAGKTFSIVENPKSQRKFINSLGMYNGERFYEAETLSKRSRGPQNCFIFSHLLIDFHDNPSMMETVKKELILEYVKNTEVDQLLSEFVLANFPQNDNEISLLEIVGMTFKYVKLQAEKAAKGSIKDVVLIVPNHWNIHQRRFLVEAANLADLYVLSLIHQNTAAAINYALSHRSTNETETILFYNLGSNSMQMTLVQFKQVKVQKSPKPVESIFVLGDYGKPYVGGLKLDYLICNYFAKLFQEKYKKPLNDRGLIRLLAQSQKVKYVLSANKQAKVFVEGIMDGIDFIATLSRRQFEEMALETFKQLSSPIKRFLFDNDLRPEDLTGIELIGGGTRVPKLQTLIGQAVQNSSIIGSHINGDQSMVLGAAFYGANSSKKFKVKGINLYDGFNFEMRIVLRNLDEDITEGDDQYYFKNVTLFKKKSRFGLTKQVSFKSKYNLIADIYKEDESGLELLASYKIDSIESINESNYKISLTFEINPIEVIQLQQVKYLYSKDIVQSYTEKVRKPKPKVQVEEVSEETEKEEEEEDQKEQQTDENKQEQDQTKNKTKTDKKKKKKQKIQYETVQRFKNVTKNFEQQLKFKSAFNVFGSEGNNNVEKSKRLLAKYQKQQEVKRVLSQSKHKLQALIYELREKLEVEQFVKYAQQTQLTKIQALLSEKSEWHEETTSNNAEDYLKEYKELNEPVQKIKKRIVQDRQREDVKKRAFQIINEYAGLTSKIQKGKGWITDEQVNSLNENITQAKDKVQKLYKKLESIPINQDSAFRNKDLIKEADIIKDQYFVLKGKPKPKDWKQQKKDKESDKESKKDEKQTEDADQVNQDQL